MRVLHVSPTYYPATYWGGPIHSVRALNNALAQIEGVELTIATTDSAGPRRSERVPALNPMDYPNQRVHMSPRSAMTSVSLGLLRTLPELVKLHDVVHLTATYSFPTLPTLISCRALGKPLVWSPRGAILDATAWRGTRKPHLKSVWNALCRHLLASRSVVHVTSEAESAATRDALAGARTIVIPNGVEVPPRVERGGGPPDMLRLIYMGRVSPKKGIERLLRAMAVLRDERVSLEIYGTGEPAYVERLNSLAASLELLGSAVVFRGHVDGDAKDRAFARADVCVVPSHTENFCMVVAEALARAVPVIASHGTPWERLDVEGCGRWIDAEAPSLARTIREFKRHDLPAMGARGRAWMLREFSWESVARQMHDVYLSIIEAHG